MAAMDAPSPPRSGPAPVALHRAVLRLLWERCARLRHACAGAPEPARERLLGRAAEDLWEPLLPYGQHLRRRGLDPGEVLSYFLSFHALDPEPPPLR